MSKEFEAFIVAAGKQIPTHGKLLVFDPGETTGMALFHNAKLSYAHQFTTKNRMKFFDQFDRIYEALKPNLVLFEDYRVYGWKRDQHSWAELHTAKLIGHIEAVCAYYALPIYSQMAHQAKQFCTDERLKEWGMYKPSLRHGRDAIRHGCYFILFGQGEPQ